MNGNSILKIYLAGLGKVAVSDQIEGGKADNMGVKDIAKKHDLPPQDIQEQVDKGKEVEKEHTDNPSMAKEIARDHEAEFPNYYDELAKTEDKLKAQEKGDLGEPSEEDKQKIINFLTTTEDLDDDKVHQYFQSLGVDPHEGEEFVYAALRQQTEGMPEAKQEAAQAEEIEREDEEKPEGQEKSSELAELLKEAVSQSRAQQRFHELVESVKL